MSIASTLSSADVSSAMHAGRRAVLVVLMVCGIWLNPAHSATLSFDGTATWWFDVNHFILASWTSQTGLGGEGSATIHVTIDTSVRTPYASVFGGIRENPVLPGRWSAAVTGFRYPATFGITLHGWDPVTGEARDFASGANIPGQWLALTDEYGVDWDVAGSYSGVGLPMCSGGQHSCSWLDPPALLDYNLVATSYFFDGPFPSRVPEPGTLALFGLGVVALGLSRRGKVA